MASVDGSFVGFGLGGMIRGLIVDSIELFLGTIEQKAIERDREGRIKQGLGADLSVLREALVERGYKAGTVEKYVRCASRFLASGRCIKLGRLRREDICEYLDELRESGLGNGALRLHLCALRTVFDRVLDLGITVGIKHVPRPVPRPPATREEVYQLMAACCTDRDRLVIDMLNRSELRPGLLRLLAAPADSGLFGEMADGDCGGSRAGKPVPLEVSATGTKDAVWMFPSPRRSGPLSTRTIRRIVERVSKSCGVRTTCTALRKADVVPLQAVA